MITQDQLKDVLDRAEALSKYLKIDEKKMEYEEDEESDRRGEKRLCHDRIHKNLYCRIKTPINKN